MISEGSCDTEDWSNDAENPALRHIWKYSQIYLILHSFYLKYYFFHCIFDQINGALLSEWLQKHQPQVFER